MRTVHAVLALAYLSHISLANTVPDLYAACSAALGIPRVALLFLATNDLHFRPLWRDWLLSARGMLPLPQIYRSVTAGADLSNAEQRVERVLEACKSLPSAIQPAYQQVRCAPGGNSFQPRIPSTSPAQYLFSVYLHSGPDTIHADGSLFSEDEVLPTRVPTGWGQTSLVTAQRLLLVAALRVRCNRDGCHLASEETCGNVCR